MIKRVFRRRKSDRILVWIHRLTQIALLVTILLGWASDESTYAFKIF